MLDSRASTYPDHRCPKRMMIEMSPERGGVHYHSETEPAVGETFHVDYVAGYDGKPAIVTGDRGILLPVTLHRDAPNHVRATYTSALQVMATSDRTLSADGNVMKIVTVSHDAFGQSQTTIGIYHRDADQVGCGSNVPCLVAHHPTTR
ncbi:hypothetical protein [Terriglobus aquaticus]|nr:hypothetical protein [Terriglobus aquaticus]